MNKNIPASVIKRLCRYYRFLFELEKNDVSRISSKELSNKMGLTASQIRQDLNCFGGFGQQGYGYSVSKLKDEIANILGIHNEYNTILIGAGNLGQAIASHMSLNKHGFNLIGVFDNNINILGRKLSDVEIMDITRLHKFCSQNQVTTAILCLPKSAAKKVLKELYSLGIRSFWNFSHYDITIDYKDAIVENVHMSDSLMTLCYKVTEAMGNNNETKEEQTFSIT